MRSASTALQNLLATGSFAVADLYTVTLVGGQVFRWTSADVDVVNGGNVYACSHSGAPRIERGKMKVVLGLEVDTLEVDIFADDSVTLNGTPFLAFAQAGGFDGATMELDRAFMTGWGTAVVGTLVWFSGRISDIEVTRTSAKINCKSWLELLNTKLPRNVYQASCMHTLFDAGCGVSKAAFAVTGATIAGSSYTGVLTALAQADGYFTQGTITFTSGANAGLKRTVKSFTGGVFNLAQPLPVSPAAGDTFTAYPGCDKIAPVSSPGTLTQTLAVTPVPVPVATAGSYSGDSGVVMSGAVHTVPGYTDGDGNWINGYSYTDAPVTMTLVTGTPATGQYAVSGNVYTFAAADGGRQVTISFLYTGSGSTCASVFHNAANFRATPYVPIPETAR